MAAYYIQHTKADSIKFVGHLDLQRALQRNLTRAELGAAFSQGFNPHMLFSSAQPLSVGMSSESEYLMAELETDLSESQILERLNATAPRGITFRSVRRMADSTPAPMAILEAVETLIRIPSSEGFAAQVRAILTDSAPMPVRTRNKKGAESDRDLRPFLLPGAQVAYEDGMTLIRLKTLAGSRSHLNLDHLLKYFQEQTQGMEPGRFVHLKRLEMFARKDGELIPLKEIG